VEARRRSTRRRSARPNRNIELKVTFRDLPIANVNCLRRAAELDHFARSASVKNEQRMLRADFVRAAH
jgi:hypothetical protein